MDRVAAAFVFRIDVDADPFNQVLDRRHQPGRRQDEPDNGVLSAALRDLGFDPVRCAVIEARPPMDPAALKAVADSLKYLPDEAMPSAWLKLELLATIVDAFVGAGDRQIGMDHFALPADELGQAIDRGKLHRNFMGYTVQKTHDMVALGVSGIGEVQGAFVQNTKKLPEYYAAVGAGRFAIERGYEMSPDDLLRRHVIGGLMCNFRVDTREVEHRFAVDFAEYFAQELGELTAAGSPAADGLVTVSGSAIEVTPLGRMFVRHICMVFDQYLRDRTAGAQPVFSRTV